MIALSRAHPWSRLIIATALRLALVMPTKANRKCVCVSKTISYSYSVTVVICLLFFYAVESQTLFLVFSDSKTKAE